MPEVTQEEARKFIAKIRRANGGISPEDRAVLIEKLPEVLEALQSTRRQLADSIKIVVDNLYSKETRFLYELIQNAEDNSYTTAMADREEPFLTFKVYPHTIIVESNEDGFSESNIRAISSVGNSTKKQNAGYIGEKGIGFKSVFKIAQKVHIQSGPFSFAFSHTRDDDDDGLGMITPFYEDPEQLPFGVRTRMTLTLLNSTKFEERVSEFRDVPDTLLIFLNRLQRLSIELYPPDNDVTTTQYSKRDTEEDEFYRLYTTVLTKNMRQGNEQSSSEQRYYTVKSDLHDLPIDEARKDKQGQYIQQGTVILAFPVDEHDEPALKQQHTYAFLPLSQVGFKFLIQADFVTQANREGVVHSKRNEAILNGVAEAFADAMESLCRRRSLMYRWMRYLPVDSISDEFWRSLWPLIRKELMERDLLEPWSGKGYLYEPSDLEKLSEKFLTEDGDPLLPDLKDHQVYLSPKYTEADFQILQRLGTRTLRWSKFVDRLEADLCSSHSSKWKDIEENGDWRIRVCKLISRIFVENLDDQKHRLSKLALIPLWDGKWVSSASTLIYFPDSGDVSIPRDLGLQLADTRATNNTAWANLLTKFGVKDCPPNSVSSWILQRYNAPTIDSFKVSYGVAHVRYLYWFLTKDQSCLASRLRLANQNGTLLRKNQHLYFPDEGDDYTPKKLFEQSTQITGFAVNFLHEDYLKAVDPGIIHNGWSWSRWLEEVLGVRRVPKLCAQASDGLSNAFQYIVSHRSGRLLGTLKKGWDSYCAEMNDAVEKELRNTAVLLANGRRVPLQDTFLPFPKLRRIASELHVIEQFPFIAMHEPLRDEEVLDWIFVKDLQIGVEENLDFYLSALKTFKTTTPALNTTSTQDQLARIYRNIQLRCIEGLDRVRDTFRRSVIWRPSSDCVESTWLSSADCVWNGPQWLKSKQYLKQDFYRPFEHFFKVSLEIPDASQFDILTDLQMLKCDSGGKNPFDDPETTSTRPSTGVVGPQYQVTTENESAAGRQFSHFQSITFMNAYKNQSFEELRLKDFATRAPLIVKRPVNAFKTFLEMQPDKVVEEVERRYEYLWQKHSSSADDEDPKSREALRFTFEDSALVYVPREKSWRPPSQCVWVESSIKIPGKACIADAYPLKKTFFTRILKVSEPTVWMYIDALIAGAKGKTSAAQIKETMALICRLGIEENDHSRLTGAAFLPVKLANGRADFASASPEESIDFAILENAIHQDAFGGKINIVDMTLEELRDTKPLLLAMGLERKFSSKLVKEITNVNGGSQDYDMTRNIRIKSQAIVRPDVTTVYRLFKRAKVYVSDGIRRSLQIVQGGRSIEGGTSRANFHFKEVEGAMHLYLSRDDVERDVCMESDLPRQMCTFLQITDPSGAAIIGAVVRKDNPTAIDRILESAGVGQVDFDFAALDDELKASNTDSVAETLVEATSNINLSTPSYQPRSSTPSGWAAQREQRSGSANEEDLPIVRDWVTPISSYQDGRISNQAIAYRRILENAVNTARQRVSSDILEYTGASILGPIATQALPQDIVREAFRTQDRDFQIGAAGELYMFEYLKGLGLPGFDLMHWTSGIRSRVKSHADYHNIDNNNDRNVIADIEYLDDSGRFTQYLVQRGHLLQGVWDNTRPMYHIEVKTTLSSDWQEPFFMSKAQERHDYQINDGKSQLSIYMICRIFNLGKGDMTGVHIYIDPETKRRNQELEFSTQTWAVKPLAHRSMPGDATPSSGSTPNLQTTGGGLFGAAAQPSSSTTTGSLFGAATRSGENDSSQDAGGFGAFGALAPTHGAFGTAASTSGGLFGSGRAPSNAQAPQTTGTGLFGTAVKSSSSNTTGSLFSPATRSGENNPSQKASGFGGFGTPAPTNGGLFGSGTEASFGSGTAFENTQAPKTTATSFFGAAVQPSSQTTTNPFSNLGSTATSSSAASSSPFFTPSATSSTVPQGSRSNFGGGEASAQSQPPQKAFGFGSLGTPSPTPSGRSGATIGTPNAFSQFAATSTTGGPSQSTKPNPAFGVPSTPGGGFGTNASTSNSSNLFGNPTTTPATGSLFGAPTSQSASGAFGSSSGAKPSRTSKSRSPNPFGRR
ncbi:MAG: hypothetical protein Q9222_006278 [Ikaeria aurantiellina]